MADEKISALAPQTGASVADGDLFATVDVSDTSMAASGTDKYLTAAELANALKTRLEPSSSDAVRYLSANGSDANDGFSAVTAKLTLSAAYTALPSTGGTISCAPGRYDVGSGFAISRGKPVQLVSTVPPIRYISSTTTVPLTVKAPILYTSAAATSLVTCVAGTAGNRMDGLRFIGIVFEISNAATTVALDLVGATYTEIRDCYFFADKTTGPAAVAAQAIWIRAAAPSTYGGDDCSWSKVVQNHCINMALGTFGNSSGTKYNNNHQLVQRNVGLGLAHANTSCLPFVSFYGGNRLAERDNNIESYNVGIKLDTCWGSTFAGSGGEFVDVFYDAYNSHGNTLDVVGISDSQTATGMSAAIAVRGDSSFKFNVVKFSNTDPAANAAGNNTYVPTGDPTHPSVSIQADNVVISPRDSSNQGVRTNLYGTASPNSSVTGSIGDEYTDTTNGVKYLKTSGSNTNTGWSKLPSATVGIADGGTGQTTQQASLDAVAGAVTNHQVLAGDNTHVTLRALTTGDLPTGTTSSSVPVGGVITAAGPQGDASHTQVLTWNAAGQLTTVTNTAIALAGSAITSGTVPIGQLPTGTGGSNVPLGGVISAAGPQGDASHTQVLTWNAAGQLTAVTNTAIALAGSAITSGTVPIGQLPTGTSSTTVPLGGVITGAGPQGDASHTQVLTFNNAGQLTAVTNTAIALAGSAITSGSVAIGQGGTGQTSQTPAFNALSPNTTKGDRIVHDGTNNVRHAVGTFGQVLLADSTPTDGQFNGAPNSLAAVYLEPSASYVTMPRASAQTNQGPLSTGAISLFAVALPKNFTVTSVTFVSCTTAATPTHWWFSLCDNTYTTLRSTSDQTSTAWAANTQKTVNLSSTFKTTYEGLYYLGIMVAGTVPSLFGMTASPNSVLNAIAPLLGVTGNGSLTGAPNDGTLMASSPTAKSSLVYAYVS